MNKKVTELTEAIAVNEDDVLMIVQNGENKQVKVEKITQPLEEAIGETEEKLYYTPGDSFTGHIKSATIVTGTLFRFQIPLCKPVKANGVTVSIGNQADLYQSGKINAVNNISSVSASVYDNYIEVACRWSSVPSGCSINVATMCDVLCTVLFN